MRVEALRKWTKIRSSLRRLCESFISAKSDLWGLRPDRGMRSEHFSHLIEPPKAADGRGKLQEEGDDRSVRKSCEGNEIGNFDLDLEALPTRLHKVL